MTTLLPCSPTALHQQGIDRIGRGHLLVPAAGLLLQQKPHLHLLKELLLTTNPLQGLHTGHMNGDVVHAPHQRLIHGQIGSTVGSPRQVLFDGLHHFGHSLLLAMSQQNHDQSSLLHQRGGPTCSFP